MKEEVVASLMVSTKPRRLEHSRARTHFFCSFLDEQAMEALSHVVVFLDGFPTNLPFHAVDRPPHGLSRPGVRP